MLNKNLFIRLFWHKFKSKSCFTEKKCDVLFIPGGISFSGFKPSVTMSRNMLPFEWIEMFRYKFSLKTIKFILLRYSQLWSFKNVDGLIYLSTYARLIIEALIERKQFNITTIPHGVSERFFKTRTKNLHSTKLKHKTIRLIYVSDISPYKHQWNVVKAVHQIREEGLLVQLELIGAEAEGMPVLNSAIKKYDPKGEFIFFKGEIPYDKLHLSMFKADIGIFASSCENLPNILLEIMATGLPIACSKMGPMPEIMKNSGEYFNPLCSKDIASKIKKLVLSAELRNDLGNKARLRASKFTWKKCADETLNFLKKIANEK